MKQEHFKKSISRSVLNNTATAAAWALSFLIEAGALSIQAFLSPSIYADFPNASILFLDEAKTQKRKLKYKEITIRQSIYRLEKHGFVEKKNSKYFLTEKGNKFAKYIFQTKKKKVCAWDKKYRVVIFDIPEKKRDIRDWLRRELNLLQYKKLQNSVFIGKFPLPGELIKEIKKYKINNCVNYLLVDKVYKNIL